MIRVLILLLLPLAAQADTIRIATFNTELSRKGPGLLLRDIQRNDEQVQAVVTVLTEVHPDIVALQGIDWDMDGRTLTALADLLRDKGLDYPHLYSTRPNSGLHSGFDLDGDGRVQGPGDAQGWGLYTGHQGLAVLSRFDIRHSEVRDFSGLLWQDLPGAELPVVDGTPFPSLNAQAHQRLSSTGHWIVPIDTPIGQIDLMTFHASPPVFDGAEDRNGLRNRDEIRLWQVVMDGGLGSAGTGAFVIAGDANLDPVRGDGRKEAVQNLLADPRLQDPEPKDPAGRQHTVEWESAGQMRVDYVLPSADLAIVDSGVFWPQDGSDLQTIARQASRHRLVWVDVSAQ
ncbi:MAG: endonuclease/exonuclease/phosphatase family protein [Pseudomonadota bacterium]